MNRHQRRSQEKQVQGAVNQANYSHDDAVVQQGLQFHQQGNLQQAIAHYQDVLNRNPEHPQALGLMGILAYQMKNYPLAEKLLTMSLARAPKNVDALMNLASVYHATGRLEEAERQFQQVIKLSAASPELWFNYGNLSTAQNQHEKAVEHFKRALQLRPEWAPAHMHLGLAYKALGNMDEARQALLRAIELSPDNAEFTFNLAGILSQLGEHEKAIAYFQALLADPARQDKAPLHNNFSLVYSNSRAWDEAIHHARKALEIEPENATYVTTLANAVLFKARVMGSDTAEAEQLYRRAVELRPDSPQWMFNLATFYLDRRRKEEAETTFRKAIALGPQEDGAYINLAVLMYNQGNYAEAETLLNTALTLFPNSKNAPSVYLNLGNIYKDSGRHDQALNAYKQALALQPNWALAHSNYLFAMHYDPEATPFDIRRETLAWAARHTDAVPARTQHSNDRHPDRRLKIGYVSADFRHHPVTTYFEPVLASHNKSKVEVYCYNANNSVDEVTTRLQGYANHWRDISALTDDEAADIITKDTIDILIDLSGHTAGNRLQLFARKPAPIQATWIGYFNTTGVKTIDYYITDKFLLPPEDEWQYTEKPLRLPHTAAMYKLREDTIPINPLPALTRGYITFGSFNALPKLTPAVMALWAEILKQVPSSKLYLKNKSFGEESVRNEFTSRFAAHGIGADRLQYSGFSPIQEYLAEYNEIDIALDPFPYNAATTAIDTLWMGIPMVSLKGDRLVSHIGESMLGVVGLSDLVAADPASYVAKAVDLAHDLDRVSTLRQTLRPTLEASPMTNPVQFTQGLEEALRSVWKEWCAA